MKKLLLTFFILVFYSSILFSQTNSVELRTNGGVLVGSYSSIQEAYNAIPSPMTQPYVVEILTAYNQSTETIPITLGAKDGSSVTNTITIRPASGNTGEIISYNSSNNIIILNDADYVTIDGRPGGVGTVPDMKIENLATSGTNANTIIMQNGATNNVLKFLHLVNYTQNTSGPRVVVFGTTTSVPNSKNVVTNCKIEGGRSGVGFAGTAGTPNDSCTVSNCEIFNWGYAGIWILSGALNSFIDSNKIYQTAGVNNTIVSGIIMSTISGATYNVRKNWIYDLMTTSTSTSSLRGIYAAGPAAGSIFNVENNMISNTLDNGSGAQTITGIEFLGSNAYTLNLYYNTALIGGNHSGGTAGATTSAGIRIGASALTLNMKNNIAINSRTGGNVNHIGFALTNTAGTLNINYNCYYATGTNGYAAYWGTTGYNNLIDYKTAATPNETNTKFKQVQFVSSTNLHLTGTSNGDTVLIGTPIAGITTDFDGQNRHVSYPYMGADEASIPLPVELVSFTALAQSNNVVLNWMTVTEKNNFGFNIERSTDKTNWTFAGFVKGNGSTLENHFYSFTDKNLNTGKYFYRLVQIDFNGLSVISNTVEVNVSLPIEFLLEQNYPNPFNPSTLISYNIPQSGLVTLKVFNVLGKEVATLVNEFKPAGKYEFEFNGKNLSNGIYFYKLEAGKNISIKKMILLK